MKRAVIIENDTEDQRDVRRILEGITEFDIKFETNLIEALDRLRRVQGTIDAPDIVIVDIGLNQPHIAAPNNYSNGDGWQLIRNLDDNSGSPSSRNYPIVVWSNWMSPAQAAAFSRQLTGGNIHVCSKHTNDLGPTIRAILGI